VHVGGSLFQVPDIELLDFVRRRQVKSQTGSKGAALGGMKSADQIETFFNPVDRGEFLAASPACGRPSRRFHCRF
jgi:hypothetical protein